ncbi:hypothetical protein V3C99_010680 [Haemonchus contortus]|nr:Protein T05C1.1 [Haemonchus contortus]
MQFLSLLLLALITTIYAKLTCTRCPFHISPKGHTNCTETCEGDVCIIVVNKYFNGTIIADCIRLHDGDNFEEGPAACYREDHRTSCACTTKDRCNDPTSPISDFTFTEKPILKGYQFTPMVGGGGSPEGMNPDTSLVNGADVAQPNETDADSAESIPTTILEEAAELLTTKAAPHDVIVTKTVSLQIGDGEVPQTQQSTNSSSNDHPSHDSDAQGSAKGNSTTKSSSYLMLTAMIIGSLTMIIASVMI